MSGLRFFPTSTIHQRLHHVHVGLFERVDWYRKWHDHPNRELHHWFALAVFAFLALLVIAFGPTALAARAPRLISVDLKIRTIPYEYGRSTRGNPLNAYTYGAEAWEADRFVYVIGAIHGSERSSGLLAAELANYLIDHQSDIPQGTRVIVIPIANPDGYQRNLRANTRNIDLNRNFATTDWTRYTRGPQGRAYGGRAPFSEKETSALKAFMERERPNVVIALHARGNLINPELHDPSKELAKRLADQTGYRYLEVWGSYPTTGTMTLWTVERFGAASITWELNSYTNPDWSRNRDALLSALRP